MAFKYVSEELKKQFSKLVTQTTVAFVKMNKIFRSKLLTTKALLKLILFKKEKLIKIRFNSTV